MLGALLRINHLWGQRAFWYDELSVLANLMERSYGGLRAPLDSDQVAPYGFLAIVKWFGAQWGFTEFAVRLPVTIASLVGLGLFYWLAQRIQQRSAATVALFLFAINNWLIYFAAETKQYTFDVLAAILIYILALPLLQRWQWRDAIGLGIAGTVLVWFSHPAAFVLGGVGLVLLWRALAEKHHRLVALVALCSLLWLSSFAGHLWFTSALGTEVTANQQNLYWSKDFMPLPPSSVNDLMWFWDALVGMYRWPFGFQAIGLAAVLTIAGAWSMWRRSVAVTTMLLLPLLIALCAIPIHWPTVVVCHTHDPVAHSRGLRVVR